MCELFTTLSGKSAAQAPAAAAPVDLTKAADQGAGTSPKHKKLHRNLAKAPPRAPVRAAAAAPAKVVVAASRTEGRLSAGVIAEMGRHHIAATELRVPPDEALASSGADFVIVSAPLMSGVPDRRVVANVGLEQLHVVAGADVHTIADLRGRPVSLGLNGSATQAAARAVLKSLGVEVKEVPLEFGNGMDALAQGSLTALAVLAPKPFDDLTRLAAGTDLHLVAIPASAAVGPGVHPGSIGHADYPSLVADQSVPTVAIDTMLAGKETARVRQVASQLRTVFLAAAQLPAAPERIPPKPN